MTIKANHHSGPDPRTILLIPTVEGRDFLAQTLSSVREHVHCFDQLLLSVNGTTPQKANQILLEQRVATKLATKVLCTRRHLSARQHLRFIHQKLSSCSRIDDYIFLLADDDLLPAEADINNYIRVVKDRANSVVGMGRIATFEDGNPISHAQSQHIEPGESISPLEFLERNQEGHRTTNISSMIIPCGIFKEASSFMWHLGSSGRRTEYIFATHKRVASLYSPPASSALIREHPNQEGRTLSFESYLHDELVYILWVWLHQPAMRQWGQATEQGFTLGRFRALLQVLLKIKLKRNAPLCYAFARKMKSLYRHHVSVDRQIF